MLNFTDDFWLRRIVFDPSHFVWESIFPTYLFHDLLIDDI